VLSYLLSPLDFNGQPRQELSMRGMLIPVRCKRLFETTPKDQVSTRIDPTLGNNVEYSNFTSPYHNSFADEFPKTGTSFDFYGVRSWRQIYFVFASVIIRGNH
jgi:hypothetical protein